MKLTRTILPAAIAAALLLTTACSGGDGKDATNQDCLAAGAGSKSLELKGTTGSDLEITSKTPIAADEMQRSVLKKGEGDTVKDGENISVAMAMFNATDGVSLQQFPESNVPMSKDQLAKWAYEGVRCAVTGQQIGIVMPYADMFADAPASETGLTGLNDGDPIVVVMEFGDISEGGASAEPGTLEPEELLKKADGKAQKAPAGFPTVKLEADGAPIITMPAGEDAPGELEVATLIEGDGEIVEPGDRVYVNYRGVVWRTGEEFDSSWSRGAPVDFMTNGVIEGFTKALEGNKVGSQVIAVVPPASGYGDQTEAYLKQSNPDLDITNEDSLVFVLDILGTVHADAK